MTQEYKQHKGVRLKFKLVHNLILGVPQPTAAIVGTVLGFLIAYFKSVFVAAFAVFLFGLIAQIPGAISVRLIVK